MKRLAASAAFLVAVGVLIHVTFPAWPRWRARVPGDRLDLAARLTPDGRLLLMPFGLERGSGPLTVLDAETGRPVVTAWNDHRQTLAFALSPSGDRAAGVVGVLDGEATLRLIDTRDGRTLEVPLGGERSDEYRLRFTPDEGRVLVERRRKGETSVSAFDPATGVRAAVPADAAAPFDPPEMVPPSSGRGPRATFTAADGSFALTLHDTDTDLLVQRWDVPPRRLWAFSVGVPVALGALLGLGAWRRVSGTRQGAEEVPA